MSAVSETMVREFFELHGFFVRQQRKYMALNPTQDEEIDFYIYNPAAVVQPTAGPDGAAPVKPELPFILSAADLAGIPRAVVAVRPWHNETFGPSVFHHNPEIFRFAESAAAASVGRVFGAPEPVRKILVLSMLPQNNPAREQSVQLLKAGGIDAVIQFSAILKDLLAYTEEDRSYQKSDVLQVIRILKTYDYLKEPQLELFRPARKKSPAPKRPGKSAAADTGLPKD
jgi:hypothetical protein